MRAKEIELVEFKLDASRPMGIEILMNDNIRFSKGSFAIILHLIVMLRL